MNDHTIDSAIQAIHNLEGKLSSHTNQHAAFEATFVANFAELRILNILQELSSKLLQIEMYVDIHKAIIDNSLGYTNIIRINEPSPPKVTLKTFLFKLSVISIIGQIALVGLFSGIYLQALKLMELFK